MKWKLDKTLSGNLSWATGVLYNENNRGVLRLGLNQSHVLKLKKTAKGKIGD